MKIFTHDGTFHSDEVFAIALIKRFINSNIEVKRTRDDNILREAKLDKSQFVIDVGGEFNEKYRNFDHHQRNFKHTWKNERILFSSCGLVWSYIKKKGYLKKYNPQILKNIEDSLIKRIDMHDNGEKKWGLSMMISIYNREESTNEEFMKALDCAQEFLNNTFYQEEMNLKKYENFLEDLKQYNPEDRFFVSKNTIKDARVLNKISNDTNALFIIYPQIEDGKEESWMIKSVNRHNEKGEKINFLAPENWRGLTRNKLSKITDLKGLLFVHRSGFLIGVNTLNQAIKVANYIIQNKDENKKVA